MHRFLADLGRRFLNDNINFLAGGVAFYGVLSLFPALGAIVAMLAMASDPMIVQDQLQAMHFLFPSDVYNLLHDQILLLVHASSRSLNITFIISVVIALVSAMRGTTALLAALNTIFRVRETRPWWKLQIVSLCITFGSLVLVLLALFVIIAMPLAARFFSAHWQQAFLEPLDWVRWTLLTASLFGGVLVLFSFGPNRPLAQQCRTHVWIGAGVGSVLWLVTSAIWSWVMGQVPQLHATYGSLSALVILMLWMLISANCLLLGAAIVAALDAQDQCDIVP